jgi:hypothetical protein
VTALPTFASIDTIQAIRISRHSNGQTAHNQPAFASRVRASAGKILNPSMEFST